MVEKVLSNISLKPREKTSSGKTRMSSRPAPPQEVRLIDKKVGQRDNKNVKKCKLIAKSYYKVNHNLSIAPLATPAQDINQAKA